MYQIVRPLLFRLKPEQAHVLTLRLLQLVSALPGLGALVHKFFNPAPHPIEAFGLSFVNPLGLAAGYDKDGLGWRGLACLGFGHVEVGTVTLHPQPGNPVPRLFRLPVDKALINRMGFPGRGAQYVARQLQAPRPFGLKIGVNLGKNKDTPLENAALDYLALLKIFAPLADYLAINVSSPNTVGLRRLQARDALEELLRVLEQERRTYELEYGRRVPLLVKLSPDLNDDELQDALQAIQLTNMDGVIATNTTLDRPGVQSPLVGEPGGLSGAPLAQRSTALVRRIGELTQGKLPIVGVGGVMTPEDALEKLEAGASLVQLYTGLVYSGPGLVKQILQALPSTTR